MLFSTPFSILSSLSFLYKTSTQYSKQKSTSSEQKPNSSEKPILSEQKPISSEKPILSEQKPASSSASNKVFRINSNPVNSRKRFKNYVAFGDSFSDNGNSYNLTNKIWPTDVNYEGHFTNGKVWTEYLAELLNIKLINYAYGGATSNSEFIQGCTGPKAEFHVHGIKQQIEMFIAANTKSNKSKNKNSYSSTLKKFLKSNKIKKSKKVKDFSRTLFSVWDTGNDYFFSDMRASPLEVVKSLIDALHLLVNSFPSINTILIPNIHDLSRIPAFKTCDIEEKNRISKMIESHNKYLLEHLVKFSRETGVKIIYLKIDKFTKELQTKDGMSCFGISNCVDAAVNLYNNNSDEIADLNNNNNDHENKDSFLFWDDYHVTTLVHDALANLSFEILEDLNSPFSIHKRNSFATKTFALTLGDYIQ
ncbi:GDSL-like Lipase/Acylhydrolase-domain-containing protein [Gigaspora rosea]|uniref:GDSL-like Lipase/Acylhydrolase-domain-containing protein n=1 Tax=Gigaspora rosea TaxID=44941 RepID=A0A397VWS4_9GLOM|nr:GDSL-like Lipase/Acylhydrolase-domain-containing protein [Gigaspora rosea]